MSKPPASYTRFVKRHPHLGDAARHVRDRLMSDVEEGCRIDPTGHETEQRTPEADASGEA